MKMMMIIVRTITNNVVLKSPLISRYSLSLIHSDGMKCRLIVISVYNMCDSVSAAQFSRHSPSLEQDGTP